MNDSKPSKSARKREVIALQALGEQLIDLSDQQLSEIDTDPLLIAHVRDAKGMKSRSALRRQKQLIGKIMRNLDPQPIRQALERIGKEGRASTAAFRQAEHWRDRIAENGEPALAEFTDATGCASDALAGSLHELRSATDPRRHKHAQRQLFREVHRLLLTKMQNPSV